MALEELIFNSWFDDEMDKIYYPPEIPATLVFRKLSGLPVFL